MLPRMPKTALILHRDPALSRSEFLDQYENSPRPGSKDAAPHTLHLPYETDALRAASAGLKPQPARCDGLSFLWASTTPAEAPRETPAEAIVRTDAYALDEIVHWDRGPARRPGAQSPGIKMIAIVQRRADLSPEEFRTRYLEHAAIAREHHPGIARYVQNFVTSSLTPGAPPVDGIAELHFATEADLTERFYGGDESASVVAEDVRRFMSFRDSWSILATEFVVA